MEAMGANRPQAATSKALAENMAAAQVALALNQEVQLPFMVAVAAVLADGVMEPVI